MPAIVSEPGLFQCGSCKRTYTRLDHLSRHVRSHTQSRPYKCYICTKGFARTDLLKRHIAGHESQAAKNNDAPRETVSLVPNAPGRVTAACKACASNHVRCTEEKPCLRCLDKDLECIWNSAMEGDRLHTPPESENQTEERTPKQSESQPIDVISTMDPRSPGPSVGSLISNDTISVESPVAQPIRQAQGPADSSQSAYTDALFLGFPDLNLLLGQVPSSGSFELGASSYTGLDDMDLRFLDTYNINVPFAIGSESHHVPYDSSDQQMLYSGVDPGQAAEMCSETFRNSHWHFRPNVRDHGAAEEHNLSLPPAINNHLSAESRVSVDTRATCVRLGVAMRDRILTIIVQSCRPENLSTAVASFPSIELLDSLLQYYLMSPMTRALSFLHAPTFDPNERRPELVAAMAASGAVLTSDPALTKLGYAIQECVRVAIPRLWESDNTMTRDLQLLQAFLITLDIGIWSGYPRKVEIAESFLQPLLTMLRRAGKLGRSAYLPTALPDGQGDALHQQWVVWIESESFKRLAFRLLLHDTNSSMALQVNPLISYAEFTAPLPDPAQLWTAGSAERWKAAFPSPANLQAIPVIEFLDDPEALGVHHDTVDTNTASLAVLSYAWSLVREYTQLVSLQRMRPRRWSALLTTSRMEELRKLIGSLRVQLSCAAPTAPEITMRLELVLLHLHMPFEEIHIFAGMEGPEQARAVYPAICEWVKSEAARRATSHAGQIIRVAKTLPKAAIRGPAAIMVYHASLAFWVYGMVVSQQAASSANGGDALTYVASSLPQHVWLDETDDLALQRFIEFGIGEPGIGRNSSTDDQRAGMAHAYLSQPDDTMEVIIRILRDNFHDLAMPLLAKKLLQLMIVFQRCVVSLKSP